MSIGGITSGISPAATTHTHKKHQADPADLIAGLGGVASSDDPFDIDDTTSTDNSGGGDSSSSSSSDDTPSNPYTQALAASSVMPIADAAGPGPVTIETFSATGSPASTSNSVYATVTDGSDTLAVIDAAGNVSMRGPATQDVRDAMAQLSSPADRTSALAQLLGGTAQSASGDTSLSGAIQALQSTPQTQDSLSGFSTDGASIPVPSDSSSGSSSSTTQLQGVDDQFESLFDDQSAQDILKSITSDGMDGYWKEELKQIQNQVANEVLASKGLTKEDVEKMPPAERMAVEQAIIKEVEERVKEIVKQEMEKQQAQNDAAKLPQHGAQATAKQAGPEQANDPAKLLATVAAAVQNQQGTQSGSGQSAQGQSDDSSAITALLTDAI